MAKSKKPVVHGGRKTTFKPICGNLKVVASLVEVPSLQAVDGAITGFNPGQIVSLIGGYFVLDVDFEDSQAS